MVEAALAGLTGPISQRPPAYSAIKVGGRRAYAMARAGETVTLAEREVTIHELDLVSWDGTDPDRPIAVLDVACSAGTYIRALARDLGERVGSAAYLGALSRTAAGPFPERTPSRSTTSGPPLPKTPTAIARLLLPIDTGLERFPDVPLEALRSAPSRAASSSGRRPGSSPAPNATGCALPTARSRPSRSRRPAAGWHRTRCFVTPVGVGHPGLMDVVTGVEGLRPEHGPIFVVVGVFDGLHRGHAYLLEHLVREAGPRSAHPAVITFDPHPDEVLTGLRPAAAAPSR